MLAMDAALLVLKDAGFTFSDLPSSIDRGSFRSVYPHPTNPEEVVKVPHAGLHENSMIDVATSQAMSGAGEPVIPERLDLIQRNVMGRDHDSDITRPQQKVIGTVPQPIFLQQRTPYGTAERTRGALPFGRGRRAVGEAMRNFDAEMIPTDDRYEYERLMNVLGRDLHTANFGFKIPDEKVQQLGEEGDTHGLLQYLTAFDLMSAIRPRESELASQDIGRMMRAKDIDPEKLNRFMELFADRSQFDSLMDAVVHQPVPSFEDFNAFEMENSLERKGIEQAYNAYVKALNEAKRAKSFVDDPYQTRLMEYDMAPLDEAPRNLGNAHPATVLRDAIIRARAQQARDALEGRPPMNVEQLVSSIHRARNDAGQDLRNELMGVNPFGEMPNIGRLLGDLQEERQIIDTAARKKQQEEIDWI